MRYKALSQLRWITIPPIRFEGYHSIGSPLFIFEPPNGVEPFSHDYKSSIIPIY